MHENDGNSLSIVYSILLTVIKSLIVELNERSSTEQQSGLSGRDLCVRVIERCKAHSNNPNSELRFGSINILGKLG